MGTQGLDLGRHLPHDLGEPDAVARADPGQAQALGLETELREDLLEQLDPPTGLEVPVDVMAVAGISTR